MKKYAFCVVLVLLLLVGLCGCASVAVDARADQIEADDSALTAGAPAAVPSPTGYPSGEIQREYVRVGGLLYVYADEYKTSFPGKATYVGAVTSVDNLSLPTEELAASRLEVGCKVYTLENGEVCVLRAPNRYERFVLCDESVERSYYEE